MLRSGLLSDTPHGFTTRADGDLRPSAEGQAKAASRLVSALGGNGSLLIVNQVHGARVVSADDILDAPSSQLLDADAIISTRPDAVIAVRVADCVPILLVGRHGVAAVHAGWKGTAAGIAQAAMEALCAAGGDRPDEVRAVIGPCISGAAYEVGPDVLKAMERVAPAGGRRWRTTGSNGRDHVDLAAVNANILTALGVHVEVMRVCTYSTPDLWSYRLDGERAGRQAAVIRWALG
ncbi:MAG: peptidoglycan editing factor PgeF [Myxococcales bacterium]|nr:peptidoglycan editing factor PgeF [Myxococcales bacterium]